LERSRSLEERFQMTGAVSSDTMTAFMFTFSHFVDTGIHDDVQVKLWSALSYKTFHELYGLVYKYQLRTPGD